MEGPGSLDIVRFRGHEAELPPRGADELHLPVSRQVREGGGLAVDVVEELVPGPEAVLLRLEGLGILVPAGVEAGKVDDEARRIMMKPR
jgi:hypothetical protein